MSSSKPLAVVEPNLYESRLDTFVFSKSLLTSLTYPWGFVPFTKADRGDPVDIKSNQGLEERPVALLNSARIVRWLYLFCKAVAQQC
jgi:hypothetical protein